MIRHLLARAAVPMLGLIMALGLTTPSACQAHGWLKKLKTKHHSPQVIVIVMPGAQAPQPSAQPALVPVVQPVAAQFVTVPLVQAAAPSAVFVPAVQPAAAPSMLPSAQPAMVPLVLPAAQPPGAPAGPAQGPSAQH